MHTAAVRRLTGDEHLDLEFATNWPQYELDSQTRAMLAYVSKLAEAPGMIEEADIEKLRDANWSENAIWEMSALASFFNFTGRLEAASGLPPDEIPDDARFAEARN